LRKTFCDGFSGDVEFSERFLKCITYPEAMMRFYLQQNRIDSQQAFFYLGEGFSELVIVGQSDQS
jgi:hypothetical protein